MKRFLIFVVLGALIAVPLLPSSASAAAKSHVIYSKTVVNDQAQQSVEGPFVVPKSDKTWEVICTFSTYEEAQNGPSTSPQFGIAASPNINGDVVPFLSWDPGANASGYGPQSGHKVLIGHTAGKFWLWVDGPGDSWTVTIESSS